MDEKELTYKILATFPDVTFKIDTKRGNLRIHFKADSHNFVPSKWMLCNVLELPEKKVRVAVKKYNDGLFSENSPGKLFTIIGGMYL